MSTSALPDKCGVGTACPRCGRRLPLRFSEPGEEAALWECVGCDAPFAGILSVDVVAMLAQRVRLAQRHFDVEHAPPLPFTLRQVVERIHANESMNDIRDLRRSERLCGLRHAVTAFVDARQCITGTAHRCAIANLSSHGMLMVTSVPVVARALIMQVESPQVLLQLYAELVWTRHLGGGCYGTGAAFVARFGRMAR